MWIRGRHGDEMVRKKDIIRVGKIRLKKYCFCFSVKVGIDETVGRMSEELFFSQDYQTKELATDARRLILE